jgi:hypothetical protein
MILTPIAREDLVAVLDRFEQGLCGRPCRAAFGRIRATSPDRAAGAIAEDHRRAALGLAHACSMPIHAPDTRSLFNWDGTAMNAACEAYVILHEVAHFMLAPPERRRLVEFGLGPGPDTIDRASAERAAILSTVERDEDEAAASLLGILWEAQLAQPALTSFLDQNWLEGLDRSAAAHFTAVHRTLRRRGLLSMPLPRRRITDGGLD